MSDILINKDNGEVATLVLNDKPANCLTVELMSAIQTELDLINNSEKHKVIVIESSNDKIFCSGHSFMEIHKMINKDDQKSQENLFTECSKMLLKIRQSRKIIISKIRGIATAGGLGLVGITDCAFSSDDAQFALGGINFDFGCHQPSVSVSRSISTKATFELLISGLPFDAKKAQEVGLINEAVPNDQLDQRVDDFCQQVLKHTPEVLAMTKEALYRQTTMSIEEAYVFSSQVMVENLQLPETKAGIAAFIEKKASVE